MITTDALLASFGVCRIKSWKFYLIFNLQESRSFFFFNAQRYMELDFLLLWLIKLQLQIKLELKEAVSIIRQQAHLCASEFGNVTQFTLWL